MKQNLFIPRHVPALLYRELESGGLQYVEGPRLLTEFYVGSAPRVGSFSPRMFGNDWWGVSNIASIREIRPQTTGTAVLVYFRTQNTNYVLEVNEKNITYRDDMDELIEQTVADTNTPEWLKVAEAFHTKITEERNERKKG